MATWPVDPSWISPITLNNGQEYNPADGITYDDINTIINDLRYLYGRSISGYVTQALSVTPATSAQEITVPTGVDGFNPVHVDAVTSAIDSNIVSSNIRIGVSILGVTGSLEPGTTPTGNINITNTQVTDVAAYATAQVVDANLVPANIAAGVTILGITGTHSGGGLDGFTPDMTMHSFRGLVLVNVIVGSTNMSHELHFKITHAGEVFEYDEYIDDGSTDFKICILGDGATNAEADFTIDILDNYFDGDLTGNPKFGYCGVYYGQNAYSTYSGNANITSSGGLGRLIIPYHANEGYIVISGGIITEEG